MADFRRGTITQESGNSYDKTRVVDPPGFDASIAREQVGGRLQAVLALAGGRRAGAVAQLAIAVAALQLPVKL